MDCCGAFFLSDEVEQISPERLTMQKTRLAIKRKAETQMQYTNETNMKTLIPKLLIALCALILLASPHMALAQTQGGLTVDNFNDAANESSGLTSTLYTVTHYALYIFYLLGIIFMGIAALKFKSGDMEAMGKNLGGSVMLFLVPKIVEVIITWAAK